MSVINLDDFFEFGNQDPINRIAYTEEDAKYKLKCIKAMQELDDGSGKASFSAIMLLVINSVSIQLLPTTIIGLREKAGSTSSSDIILPIIISSLITCVFAVLLTRLFSKIKRKKV